MAKIGSKVYFKSKVNTNAWSAWSSADEGLLQYQGGSIQSDYVRFMPVQALSTSNLVSAADYNGTGAYYRQARWRWYFATPQPMTWKNAQAYAALHGGVLATVSDTNDNDWILGKFPGDAWIGRYREEVGGAWKWLSASGSNFSNWATNEPGTNAGTYYACLGTNGQWSAADGQALKYGIIETTETSFDMIGSPAQEPLTVANRLALGQPMGFGAVRGVSSNFVSLLYAFVEDRNGNGRIDRSEDFLVEEWYCSITNQQMLTLDRKTLNGVNIAQHYAVTGLGFTNGNADVFFTGEPDGRIMSWVAGDASNALQSALFNGNDVGKEWHALASVRTYDSTEGLVGLRVDPANSQRCDVVYWPPQRVLWTLPSTFRQTAPVTRIMPSPSSGGGYARVGVKIWDAEGNSSLPYLQYQDPASSNWTNAALVRIDNSIYTEAIRVATHPTGLVHTVVWNAGGGLGVGFSNNVLIRARSRDVSLWGDWSLPALYRIDYSTDSDGDGMPDDWEAANGLDPTDGSGVNGPSADPDGDGADNRAEYLADTNPLLAGSLLEVLGLSWDGASLRVIWKGGQQATQYVERSPTLIGTVAVWSAFYTNLPPTAVTNTVLDTLATNSASFYRIRATRP
ncbi:MAG: hypothetical protein HY343_06810 [Lentisphaerae bacterium]|nr:hypothetical protein [Lentisphaerota bacterium]